MIAPRFLCRQRERHGDRAVRAIAGARAASSPRGRNRRMVSLNRAEPRCSRFPARPRYDFLTAPTSGAGAVLWRMSIA